MKPEVEGIGNSSGARERGGLRRVLSIPGGYRLFLSLIGATDCYRKFVHDHVRPEPGTRLLDIGCGPGSLVPFLDDVEYVGFDISADYIEAAKQRFGDRGTFMCQDVNDVPVGELGMFDIVVSYGVVHHLPDPQAELLFAQAHAALRHGGRLITCDGVFADVNSAVADWILRQDRGKHVRTSEGYESVARRVFESVTGTLRKDLIRLPYTHLVLECVRGL